MAISFVGANSADGDTVSIPAHASGDLLIIYAVNDASSTPPSLPAGWTNIGTGASGSAVATRLGYKIAASSSETSGTWTNSNVLSVSVYRGSGPIIGASASAVSTTSTITYPALTLAGSDGWVAAFFGGGTSTTLTTPTGLTQRTYRTRSGIQTCTVAISDTNSTVSSWTATNATAASNNNAVSFSLEILEKNVIVTPTGTSATGLLGTTTQAGNSVTALTGVFATGQIGTVDAGTGATANLIGVSTQVRVGNVFAEPIENVFVSGVVANAYLNYAAANIWTRIVTSGTV